MEQRIFWLQVGILIIVAILAVGNWQLYGRVEQLELLAGLR